MAAEGDVTTRKSVGDIGPGLAHEGDVTRSIVPDEPRPSASAPLLKWKQFEVRNVVGSGGFGEVYLAWDTQLHREVALKILRPHPGDDDGDKIYQEILNEARALARVRHPNVVPV